MCLMGALCFGCGIIFNLKGRAMGSAFAGFARGRAGLAAGVTLWVWRLVNSGPSGVRYL